MKSVISFFILLFISATLYAQNLELRLDSLLQGHVDNGEIHGCLAYVFQKGEDIVLKPYGFMDIENKRPMEKDAIFRIASMTKILTAAAALKLYEEGKFLLDEPVKKYIPGFSDLRVISPECKSEDSIITLPLERDVTIRDLFRHTAGFGYGGNDLVGRLYAKAFENCSDFTLQQFVEAIISVPLKYQPGSKWEYSFANDILGYLIEVISGNSLDEYMNEAIFEPLGMINTGFYVPQEKLNMLCNHYSYKAKQLTQLENPENTKFAKKPMFISGGGGALSTYKDYSRFCQMILNYGELNGKRILNRQTVELLISDQIGQITDRSFELSGYGFGIGVEPGLYCGKTTGCYWAGGPYNTFFTIDFTKDLIAILLIQNSPWGHLNLRSKFRQIVNEETE